MQIAACGQNARQPHWRQVRRQPENGGLRIQISGAEVASLLLIGSAMTVLLSLLSPSRATPYTALALTGLNAMNTGHVKRRLFGTGARSKPAGGGTVISDELSYGKFVESSTCRRIAGRSGAPTPVAQLAAMPRRPRGVFPAEENRERLALFTRLRGFVKRYEGLETEELVKHMNHVVTRIMRVIYRHLWMSEQPWAGAARFSALHGGGMASANGVGQYRSDARSSFSFMDGTWK